MQGITGEDIMTFKNLFAAAAILGLTASVYAQGVPGKDRPIRVGQYKGTGTSRYWHTNIHTSGVQLAAILANPKTTGLGDTTDLVVPTAGFTFQEFGLPTGTGTPTTAQRDAFIAALDTLDVVIISCFVDIGNSISAGAPRTALMNHIQTKGYIAAHATTDSYGTWAGLDSIHAARFQNHPSSDRNGRLRLDSLDLSYNDADSSWHFLNRSLADTTFLEEWFSFTTNGNVIRSYPGVKVTINIDESSYNGGLGGARAMGADHPMSWYRKLPTGGRFFYTAVGHRANIWQGGTQPRFLRRQLYNAILWTAGYDTAMVVSVKPGKPAGRAASDFSRLSVSPNALTVTLIPGGNHSVELMTVDGKRVAFQQGEGREKAYNFTGLRPGVYAVAVATAQGRSNRLVTIQ
jgi:hypothetical protein